MGIAGLGQRAGWPALVSNTQRDRSFGSVDYRATKLGTRLGTSTCPDKSWHR